VISFPRLNNLKVHEKQIYSGQSIDPKAYINDGVENLAVLAGHMEKLLAKSGEKF
jgi:hypothetical protein